MYVRIITAQFTQRRVNECLVLNVVKFSPQRKMRLRKPADLVDVCVSSHPPIFPTSSMRLSLE